ncbi:unnamed protein product [Chironomus riparius]|uniref:Nucleolar protein 14 n=1 Tax=Chironomus riparius TaxID=315576 RepID=A0A9N9S0D8_9DIPT|nr:unnamed protein product [Chironomus riparius]
MKAKKGKKGPKSDAIYDKKSKVIVRKENPFELHVNREKFNVLNRKTHHSFGKPLLARQNAFEKRKQTLGAEYKVQNKSNLFEDRRKSGFKKLPRESIYNLNDSEQLTHRGQTLEQIEQFDDARPDDDDEMSDEELRLDANFTKVAHFGGGNDEESMIDRKTAIDELIADSKKRKAERVKEHEEMLDLTNKLDSDYKHLLSVVKTLERTETPEKPEADEYDRLVKEMIFLPRGEPTNKLKSEDEIARIEKEKLDMLEMDRQRRMQGDEDNPEIRSTYRSADDLDDGYFLEPVIDDEDDKVLSYPLNPEDVDPQNEPDNEQEDDIPENGEIGSKNEEIESENESENADEEQSESESDADSLEDLKADNSESDENTSDENDEIPASTAPTKLDKKNIEPMDHIPFTISLPETYEKFIELLGAQSIKIQSTIIERIIKTDHPKLHFSNRNKMIKLFAYLLQYVNDLFLSNDESNITKHFKLVHNLSPLMFDLIQMNPEDCSSSFLEVFKEKYEDYKKNQKAYPKLDTIIFFKFLSSLFPTSDFRHPVVTPSYIFLHHILSQCKVKTRSDVMSGLYLVTLTYDYQRISKRFLPAVLNFLKGICYLGIKKSLIDNSRPIPPFKKKDELLVVSSEIDVISNEKLKPTDFLVTDIDDEFKVRAISTAVGLIKDYMLLYEELVGVQYLIDSFESLLSKLSDEEKLPETLKATINEVLKEFDRIKSERKFKYPEAEKKSLPMLRMLEPRFEAVHSDRRQMYCQSQGNAAEKKKLQHMLKREKKSAKRELIKDNEFLSKIKHRRMQQMDVERKEKVRRILHEGNVQQSEFKALSRTKGRKGIF